MQKKLRPEVSGNLKTIGILGGLGPQATIAFEHQIHKVSQKLIKHFENQGYPPIFTYYVRHQPFIIYEDGTRPIPLTPHPHLLEVAKMLGAVADFLVIPSNTPHFFLKELTQASGKKVLNMIEMTINEVKRRKCKNVGILAMGHTLTSQLYQSPLNQLGIVTEGITDESLGKELDKELFNVMQGDENAKSTILAVDLVNHLRGKNVDAIIIACTELPLLLGVKSNAPDLINPSQCLAEATVRFAINA